MIYLSYSEIHSPKGDGKIHSITRTAGSAKPDLEFVYDALGNRIAKKVIPEGGGVEITYYIRDAQGHVMSTYNITSARLTQQEQHIYGSSRLGMRLAQPLRGQATLYGATYGLTRGHKRYELSNHLGNVLSVITDRKNGEGRFQPHVLSHTDYYPFGAPMETGERTWVLVDANAGEEEGYRYGFNTQEEVHEITGSGNHTTAKFWEYSTRIGIRWNRDPVVDPSISSYATHESNPIRNDDPDGDCSVCPPPQITASLSMTLGSHNNGISFSASISQQVGNWNVSMGVGFTGYSSFANTGMRGFELRGSAQAGFNYGRTSLSLGTNVFRGLGGMSVFSQRTGILNVGFGKFSASYENDGTPFNLGSKLKGAPWLGDGDDKYRTAAVRVGFGQFSVGFNLFTGLRDHESYLQEENDMGVSVRKDDPNSTVGTYGERMPHGFVSERGARYRMGALFAGYGQVKLGIDSDRYVRHPIQDIFAHHIASPQPGFRTLSDRVAPYYQATSPNLFEAIFTPKFSLYE